MVLTYSLNDFKIDAPINRSGRKGFQGSCTLSQFHTAKPEIRPRITVGAREPPGLLAVLLACAVAGVTVL